MKINVICEKLTKHTKLLLRFEFAVFTAIVTAAAVCSILANATPYYYELIQIKSDLLATLRPCVSLIGVGALIMQHIEGKST